MEETNTDSCRHSHYTQEVYVEEMLSTKVLSKLQTLSKPWFALTAWMFYYILGALIVFMLNPFLTNYEGSPSVSQALRDVLGKGEAPIALASRWLFLVALVGFAPLVETLILQSAPVSILRRFGITAPKAGYVWQRCGALVCIPLGPDSGPISSSPCPGDWCWHSPLSIGASEATSGMRIGLLPPFTSWLTLQWP